MQACNGALLPTETIATLWSLSPQAGAMRIEYFYIAVVALLWGGYPLVARSASVAGHFGTLILALTGLIPVVAAVLWQEPQAKPSLVAMGKMAVAGLMMGVGLVAFIAVTNSRHLDASVSIPIMDTAMLVVTVVGAILFFAEPVTAKKVVGLALLIGGILTLRPH